MLLVRATLITFFAWTIFLFLTGNASAQTSCGNIVGEEYGESYSVPIEDCDNPFGPVNLNSNLGVTFGSTTIENGGVYEFLNSTSTFVLSGTHPDMFTSGYTVYRHEGSDYRKVGEGAITNPYSSDVSPFTFNASGTYSLIIYEDAEPILSHGFVNSFLAFFIPKAYAFPGISLVLTFEVVAPEPVPTGISNILFLPGMQGSRLYMMNGSDEEQLWEPFGSGDYEKLSMTESGESIHDVYTRDVIDSIYGGIGGDVYDSFIDFLDSLDGENGPLVQVFPYDWRYDVLDLLDNGTKYETGLYKKLVETVYYLATLSKTDKVTIIAHSNGGLLAKALMVKLEELGKAEQIDKIIFIATPHTGTPKAIAAILHGYDQEQALNIPADARDIRRVIKNMPGPYGLLPSEAYFSTLSEPMISFDDSTTTKVYRDRYGFAISTMAEYRDFLNGAEGRNEDVENIAIPTKANNAHLNEALDIHANILDSWVAPDGVEVFNIVGTGLETPKAIQYKEFVYDLCVSPQCAIRKIEPVVEFSRQGDETVMMGSALSVAANNYYVDLFPLDEEFVHANITELDSIQTLVNRVVHGSSTEGINYVSVEEPTISSQTVLIDRIHSPARIYIEDSSGRRTGRDSINGEWKEEVPGTRYYEIGGVKYILKPKNFNHRVVIEGEGNGIFTHVVDELTHEGQTTLHTLVAIVAPTTRVTYTYANGTTSPVTVDQNGDGVIDYQLTIDGALIDTKATYPELRTAIRNLKLAKLKEAVLLGIADQAEQFYKRRAEPKSAKTYEKLEEGALYLLDQTLIQFRKTKSITAEEYQGVKVIIDKLIKQ